MIIRKYLDLDFEEVNSLFYECINTINAKDYNNNQVLLWSQALKNNKDSKSVLLRNNTVVAVKNDTIVGFGSLDKNYLQYLFVHKCYQKQAIATAICDVLEASIKNNVIETQASITAYNFFLKRQYVLIKKQTVFIDNTSYINYLMQK
ncbi:GNAT family N-acetyltransferase [Mycoplasma sp. P36-A1]|uniref:GNAT family N-acetyltransferase n=1 Tax=Mycoplasma sp. P36-A1 TaxID=3252900 RepID=UPI003C2AD45E